MTHSRSLILALGTLLAGAAQAMPVVHTTDFIPDLARNGFNGFERASTDASGLFYGGAYPYVEDGIEVTQVDGDPAAQIWLTCGAIRATGYCFGQTGHEGKHSWFPNNGDSGYTRIARSGGGDFESVGFLVGNSWTSVAASYMTYSLLNDGVVVLSGRILVPQRGPDLSYLGFGGGGFDELQLSLRPIQGGDNGLALDSIELAPFVPLPTPTTFLLVAVGLLLLGGLRRATHAPQVLATDAA
jgi:hypothetical protein